MKSKLGVSVGLIGAAIYFFVYFGGLVPAILLVGYVLLCEDNEWLRRNAIKAVALYIFFSLVSTLIYLVPDILSLFNSILGIFEISFGFELIYSVVDVFVNVLNIIKTCLFLLLGASAFTQGTIAIPFIDKMINQHLQK